VKKLRFISRYFIYRAKAIDKYKIHSPFLYDFVTKVLEDKTAYEEYNKIGQARKELFRSRRSIEVIDFGASARSYPYSTSVKRIDKIAGKTEQPVKFSRLLFRISRYYKPQSILELGTSLGISTMNFALGNRQSRIITVEGCANIASVANDNFRKAGLENIQIVIGNFDNALPKLLKTTMKPDLVFFDGNHRKEKTIQYFEQCLSSVNNNTIYVFDDIHWSKGMEEAWEIIKSNEQVTMSVDLFFMGIIFFRKELSKQDFTVRF